MCVVQLYHRPQPLKSDRPCTYYPKHIAMQSDSQNRLQAISNVSFGTKQSVNTLHILGQVVVV